MNRPFGAPASVSVVIPACNEGEFLASTVTSVLEAMDRLPTEVVVVDDGSTDGSCDFLRHERTPVRLVQGGGLGVARARNLGASVAEGEMLVFLDGHCTVDHAWTDRLAEAMRSPDVALVSPVFTQLGSDEPRAAGMGWADATLNAIWYEPAPDHDRPYEVPLACGACQAFPASTFHALGRFDDGFTRWGFEDHEMAVRAWLLGYRVVAHPQVAVAHYFRSERSNYEVDDTAVLFNFLRLAYVHFSEERVASLVDSLAGFPTIGAALDMLARSDAAAVRSEMLAVRQRSDDWFFDTFFPHLN